MHERLVAVTNGTVLVIDAMVLVIIAIGTIQTFARWLVAGLTFQLAADILATLIAPSWDELVRRGTIAAIGTLLNFLEKDLSEVCRLQFEPVDDKSTSE